MNVYVELSRSSSSPKCRGWFRGWLFPACHLMTALPAWLGLLLTLFIALLVLAAAQKLARTLAEIVRLLRLPRLMSHASRTEPSEACRAPIEVTRRRRSNTCADAAASEALRPADRRSMSARKRTADMGDTLLDPDRTYVLVPDGLYDEGDASPESAFRQAQPGRVVLVEEREDHPHSSHAVSNTALADRPAPAAGAEPDSQAPTRSKVAEYSRLDSGDSDTTPTAILFPPLRPDAVLSARSIPPERFSLGHLPLRSGPGDATGIVGQTVTLVRLFLVASRTQGVSWPDTFCTAKCEKRCRAKWTPTDALAGGLASSGGHGGSWSTAVFRPPRGEAARHRFPRRIHFRRCVFFCHSRPEEGSGS